MALQKRGLRLKPGTSLAYKGALEVKLSVEVEDEEEVAPTPAPSVARQPLTLPPHHDEAPPAPVNLEDVLAASRNLEKTKEGKFERPLVNNQFMQESHEWPGPPPEND